MVKIVVIFWWEVNFFVQELKFSGRVQTFMEGLRYFRGGEFDLIVDFPVGGGGGGRG